MGLVNRCDTDLGVPFTSHVLYRSLRYRAGPQGHDQVLVAELMATLAFYSLPHQRPPATRHRQAPYRPLTSTIKDQRRVPAVSRSYPKLVYTAPSESAALDAFAEFSEQWEKKYPAIIRLWTNVWAEFVPFLRFDQEIRAIICTTNAIVILSGFEGVLDVHGGRLRSGDSLGGRGYLRPSITRIPGRFDACSAGGDARLTA